MMTDKKRFQELSVYIECASGLVPKVETVKRYLDVFSRMGYTRLYLGMADAYKIPEEPYFNYKRGGYTTEDLREMDAYAKKCGLELIAQIHTLSHLHFLHKYPEYADIFDTDNVVMVGEERVYELAENMIRAISEGLSTRRIHIGMDEAFRIGTGNYLKKYGPADKKELILKHFKRILEILDKYGYTCELWGDMLIETDNTHVTAEEVKQCIPKDAVLYAWDYEENDEGRIKDIVNNMQNHTNSEVAFAGAVWRYLAYGPCNRYSMSRILPQMKVCHEQGISHYMVTLWADDTSRASVDATFPSLFMAAEYGNGTYDGEGDTLNKEKFYEITGVQFDDMMALDYLDDPFRTNSGNRSSSSFWMFYTDLFLGSYDLFADLEANPSKAYLELAEQYGKLKEGPSGHIFEMSESVMRVLAVKTPLPARIRAAYENKDKTEILNCIEEIKKLKEEISAFRLVYDRYYKTDNRAFGAEIHQLYLGGQMVRCDYAVECLLAFVERGEKIDELEEGVLPFNYNPKVTLDNSCMVDYRMLISYCMK